MGWFRCSIEGENFPLEMDGEPMLLGFFTTRWVEARDKDDAELRAVDLIRRDAAFKDIRRGYAEPIIRVSEIDEATSAPANANAGFSFFRMGT